MDLIKSLLLPVFCTLVILPPQGMADPELARAWSAEGRALKTAVGSLDQQQLPVELADDLVAFSDISDLLADSHEGQVPQDLVCILRGISEDVRLQSSDESNLPTSGRYKRLTAALKDASMVGEALALTLEGHGNGTSDHEAGTCPARLD